MYIPDNLWPQIEPKLVEAVKGLKVGQPDEVGTFVTAVINEASFDKISTYLNAAQSSSDAKILVGGKCDKSKGFFIEPTIIVAKQPKYATMTDELFGPVLTIYVYPADKYDEV